MILKNQKTFLKNSFLFLISTLAFAVCYFYFSNATNLPDFKRFQKEVYQVEKELASTISVLEKFDTLPNEYQFQQIGHPNQLVYIYQNDTLVRWNGNTQKMPILLEKSIDGISNHKSTDGWYLTATKTIKNKTYRVSEKIYNEYPFENTYLQNGFTNGLFDHLNASLIFDAEIGYPIYSANDIYLFSIYLTGQNTTPDLQSYLITGLLLLSILSFIRLSYQTATALKPISAAFLWTTIIALRILALKFNWLHAFSGYEIFQANLFAIDFFAPNLFEFIISIYTFLLTSTLLIKSFKPLNRSSQIIYISQTTFTLLVWAVLAYYISGFVFHSTLLLATQDLFKLNAYSILAILIIGSCCLYYYQITEYIYRNKPRPITVVVQLIIYAIWLLFSLFVLKTHWSLAMYPILLFILLSLFRINSRVHSAISYLIFGLTTAFTTAIAIQDLTINKEIENRPFFASQLFNERDFTSELSYRSIDSAINTDRTLHYYLRNPEEYNSIRLEEYLEKKYFNKLSNQYDISYYIFDSINQNISDNYNVNSRLFDDFEAVKAYHSIPSDLAKNIYFVQDYIAQYSYIIKKPIYNRRKLKGTLICTLKSKKIPEAIGFPKLLIAETIDNQALLAHYSFARYNDNSLVNQFGSFEYPFYFNQLDLKDSSSFQPFVYDGYNHALFHSTDEDFVLVSVKLNTFFELTTSISFFFISFLLVMVLTKIPLIYQELNTLKWSRLATKIQIAIIALITLTLGITTWGTGVYFKNRFISITNQQIKEKTISVEKDIMPNIGRLSHLPSNEDYALLNGQLKRLSRIHQTDINIYNTLGHLIATSRQQLYNNGLLSEQMNPEAIVAIYASSKKNFIHGEKIGELNYSSSYAPLQNYSGDLIGSINLQFFGQQESIEAQMNDLFATLINIFLLIFVVATILTIIIGSWITSPLRQLQNSLSKLRFGNSSTRLSYSKKDEIGDLVEDYNLKIEELEETAKQLAKSERESAWRDMAKQVAHEIKNPLTPMKLSVQQLQRSIDLNPDDPQLINKVNRVSNSLIEQIEVLTRIANEFSNFAKMPTPKIEEFDIVQLINSTIHLFESENNIEFIYEGPVVALINGDKDQLLRVVNNLLKNAIQAIHKEKGQITVRIKAYPDKIILSVTDNGSGIHEEQINKMFIPYFTTKNTGTGVGLSMVKQIVENHGGTINFETELNNGTTFTIVLPLKREEG